MSKRVDTKEVVATTEDLDWSIRVWSCWEGNINPIKDLLKARGLVVKEVSEFHGAIDFKGSGGFAHGYSGSLVDRGLLMDRVYLAILKQCGHKDVGFVLLRDGDLIQGRRYSPDDASYLLGGGL